MTFVGEHSFRISLLAWSSRLEHCGDPDCLRLLGTGDSIAVKTGRKIQLQR